ncbi:MAG: bifunctional phosphopantothenoylcysteine decarboxylase/phosphopantothenate--cysteine ligase CoaBC [Bacillota bacterium]
MRPNILLGITGGIAAYKMAYVASGLTKAGFNVNVVMTEAAKEFISPVTFRALTHNPVEDNMFSPPKKHDVKHISLADNADLILLAPATGNFIGKIASGVADDLLSAIVMASRAQIMIAPAMNVNMYDNQVVQQNIEALKQKGYIVLEPGEGYLACGYEGGGRLPEPEELIEEIKKRLTNSDLLGKHLMITAGPTREAFDPVRYFSNYSTGKMGYALAQRARARGAEVTLISGPTHLAAPSGVKLIKVNSAEEMAEAAQLHFPTADAAIMAAAVADYRPISRRKDKLKKSSSDTLTIEMTKNPDIIKKLNEVKTIEQKIVGFAAESSELLKNARQKFKDKNLDILIANDISREDIGFASDKNEAILFTEKDEIYISLRPKEELADLILDQLKVGLELRDTDG